MSLENAPASTRRTHPPPAQTAPPAASAVRDNEKGWAELQHAAVVLAASGNLTTLAGNGPTDQKWTDQADWAKYSQSVAEAGLATVQAMRARNTKALNAAGDQLVLTCINCHREYKLDVPAIWTERQFPPGANGAN